MQDLNEREFLLQSDLKRVLFEYSYKEFIERIRLRYLILFYYLAAVSAIIAAILAREVNYLVLLIIPVIALGATIIASHHNAMIGWLGLYCGWEFPDIIKKDICKNIIVPSWHASCCLKISRENSILFREKSI